jgi:hypothetical protein
MEKHQFTEDGLRKYWGSGETITFRGKKYKVNKMSYGDYFLEPASWKGGETEGFAPNTIWLKRSEKYHHLFDIDEHDGL